MAESSISVIASDDNPVTHAIEGKPAVSSKEMCLHFQKKHKEILRDIARIRSVVSKDFFERNFAPIEIEVSVGFGVRKDPAYLLSRDAFSLLAMGFTGSAAIRWKLKYIEAFNALEKAALEEMERKALQKALALRQRLTPERRALMNKALRYRKMGLELREIGKLMDCSHQKVFFLLKDSKLLGLEA